jgi:hypothetical protein
MHTAAVAAEQLLLLRLQQLRLLLVMLGRAAQLRCEEG